jgi:hypothetical protein
MGVACSTYWGRAAVYTRKRKKKLMERNHLEDPGVDGRIILRWIFRKWLRGMDWIHLTQDKDR